MDKFLREEIHQMHAKVCSALADPNRILILYTLADEASNVTDLAKRVELPQPTVSRHLKVLRDRGMVQSQRQGQSVIYRLGDTRIIEALDILRVVLATQLKNQGALARSANQPIAAIETSE
ncbi:MAG: ArsR family transcriptional regulator [Chloroflexi bacterium]|nr:MAG: ArsR family transcriptional regulator [Chloroflexota bacterium]MBL1194229.1 ArsR family transcriptional regulator [Chloroflexota bacterium]NOH11522.1 winged helix-turn-helix transcriptional regulator [Chloroflexota bacterium]